MDPIEIHHHIIDRLALVNGLVSGLALYPQVWQVLSSGSVQGISLFTFSLILLNSLIWVVYAVHRGLISLGIASLLNSLACAILIGAIYLVR